MDYDNQKLPYVLYFVCRCGNEYDIMRCEDSAHINFAPPLEVTDHGIKYSDNQLFFQCMACDSKFTIGLKVKE